MTPEDADRVARALIFRLQKGSLQALEIARIAKLRPSDAVAVVLYIRQIRIARDREYEERVLRLTHLFAQAEQLLKHKVAPGCPLHHLACYLAQVGDWVYVAYGITRLTAIKETHAAAFIHACRAKGDSPRVIAGYRKAIRLGLGLLREP